MLSAVSRFLAFAALVLFVGAPLGARADFGEDEALIGGGERIGTHEGAAGDIHAHEGRAEDIHAHEGRQGDIHAHEAGSESLAGHHAGSGKVGSRESRSESLSGMENDPRRALSEARQKLLDARQRHARAVQAAEVERSGSETSQTSETQEDRITQGDSSHGTWSHRLEMAKHRILVAEARVQVMDTAYAQMIRNDHPRGDARQQLIEQRQQAKQRLQGEQARLPQLVARARQEGVPAGVLSDYSD
jgi:hypothetical protein